MQGSTRARMMFVLIVATVPVAACGHKEKEQSAAGNVAPTSTQPSAVPNTSYNGSAAADTIAPKHHSKAAGAAVGAVAGHMVHHPIAGAVAGAVIQHERNKHKK